MVIYTNTNLCYGEEKSEKREIVFYHEYTSSSFNTFEESKKTEMREYVNCERALNIAWFIEWVEDWGKRLSGWLKSSICIVDTWGNGKLREFPNWIHDWVSGEWHIKCVNDCVSDITGLLSEWVTNWFVN